jgi:hypothetical protein
MLYRARRWDSHWQVLRQRRDDQARFVAVLYIDVTIRGCTAFQPVLDRAARRLRRLIELTSQVGEIVRDQPIEEVVE